MINPGNKSLILDVIIISHKISNAYLSTPSTHSSMKVKDLVCNPSPHISNWSLEVRVFRQNAAGAFSLPPV